MRFIAGFIAGLAALALVAVAAVWTGTVPANADRGALPGEKWAAKTSLRATLRREAPKSAPFQPTEADLVDGARLYVQNCSVCHGSAHTTPNAIVRGFYIEAPQFNKDDVTDDPVGVTYWKVTHGIAWTGMPAFGKTLSDRERWQIAWLLKDQEKLPPAAQAIWENPRTVPPPTPLPAPAERPTPAIR